MAAPTKGYRVTRTWEGRIIPRTQTQREPSISVSINVCAICVVLFVPSVAHVEELRTDQPDGIHGEKCARCGRALSRSRR